MTEDSWSDGLDGNDGRRHVLLVDDNDLVRRLLVRMLEDVGYVVSEASTAGAAISTLEDPDAPVDLLLSDLVLPDRDGSEVAETARRTRPGLPVVCVSGYGADAIDDTVCHCHARLSKPFTEVELRAALESATAAVVHA